MHVREEDLELYILLRLTEEESAAIEQHVAGCDPCGLRLAETIEFLRQLADRQKQSAYEGQERRREPRISTNDLASMHVLNPLLSEWSKVQILDVSKGGLKLGTAESMAVGATVQLRLKGTFVLGEVRYCRRAAELFHVGIEIWDTVPIDPGSRADKA
jgi:hypothetical protein